MNGIPTIPDNETLKLLMNASVTSVMAMIVFALIWTIAIIGVLVAFIRYLDKRHAESEDRSAKSNDAHVQAMRDLTTRIETDTAVLTQQANFLAALSSGLQQNTNVIIDTKNSLEKRIQEANANIQSNNEAIAELQKSIPAQLTLSLQPIVIRLDHIDEGIERLNAVKADITHFQEELASAQKAIIDAINLMAKNNG